MFLRLARHFSSIVPLFLLALLLLFVGSRLHDSMARLDQRKMAEQHGEADASNDQPTSIAAPALTRSSGSEEERQADRQQQIATDAEMLRWTRVIARTGIVSVVITALILIFQTVYTGKAADAASANAKAALLAERAYLGFADLSIGVHVPWPKDFSGSTSDLVCDTWFGFDIKNFGHTPGTVTGLVVTFTINDGDLPAATEPSPEVFARSSRAIGVVQPGERRHWRIQDSMTWEEWQGVSARTTHLWILVWLRYIDGFGHQRRTTLRARAEISEITSEPRMPHDMQRIDTDES